MRSRRTRVYPPLLVFLLGLSLLLGGYFWKRTSPLLKDGSFANCAPGQQGRPFVQQWYGFHPDGRVEALAPGAGPESATLVLVHGYHSAAGVWDALLPQLRLYAPAAGPAGEAPAPPVLVRVLRVCYRTVDHDSLQTGAAALARLLQEYPPAPDVPLYFIGHSFGGLVIRKLLADDAAGPRPAFQRWPGGTTVVTIDTPHHGTRASWLRFLTFEGILRQMDPDHPDLQALHRSASLDGLRVHTIGGEYHASPFNAYLGAALLGGTDGVVPGRSAHLDMLNRDWQPQRLHYLGRSPVACTEGSRPGWRRYVFTSPVYRQDVFHTRINAANEAVAHILTDIIRGGGVSSLECAAFTPDPEAFPRWLVSLLAILLPLAGLGGALWYAARPRERRVAVARRFPPLALLRWLVLREVQGLVQLPPDRGLDWRGILWWGGWAAVAAFLPSFGLTLLFHVAGREVSPIWLVLIIACAEQGLTLYMFDNLMDRKLSGYDQHPHVELECRSYGWLFGAVIGVAEQALFTAATGGWLALGRACVAIPARMALGWAMGWLYGRMEAAVRHPRWAEGGWTLLALSALHTMYAALMVHVLEPWDALIILACSLAAPSVILYVALVRPARRARGRVA